MNTSFPPLNYLLQSQCDGTGRLYLVGCGYNAYPVGSQYAEYPQMDHRQKERQNRKYRYILHAEQNALTFRWGSWEEAVRRNVGNKKKRGAIIFTISWQNPVIPIGIWEFCLRAEKFPTQISFIFKLVKQICCADQHKAAWFNWLLWFCTNDRPFLHMKTHGAFIILNALNIKPFKCSNSFMNSFISSASNLPLLFPSNLQECRDKRRGEHNDVCDQMPVWWVCPSDWLRWDKADLHYRPGQQQSQTRHLLPQVRQTQWRPEVHCKCWW